MEITRRTMLQALAAGVLSTAFPLRLNAAAAAHIKKKIPSSGESIPVVGMGTWQTFNVGDATALRKKRAEILKVFFEFGGGMIDSSPMYGSAHEVVGWCLNRLKYDEDDLFSADKIWTSHGDETVSQLGEIRGYWNIPRMDLMHQYRKASLCPKSPHASIILPNRSSGR